MTAENWLEGFRKRIKNLSLRKPGSTSLARAMAFNRYFVKAFFNNLKIIFCNLKPLPTRIWNLGETGVNTVTQHCPLGRKRCDIEGEKVQIHLQ